MISVGWSKTIQFNQKNLDIPLFPIKGSPLCLVKVLQALINLPGKRKQHLFAFNRGVPFTYNSFQTKFKKMLKLAGYNHKSFSSHSLRWGGCAWAFRSGVPKRLIQVQGDWSSDAYKRYLNFPIKIRAVVNLKMRETIKQDTIHFY